MNLSEFSSSKNNVPVKEEANMPCISPAATAHAAFHASESDGSDSEGGMVEPNINDAVCSLRDEEYKNALTPDILELADMKQKGEGDKFDIRQRAGILLKQFGDKLGAGGRYLKWDRGGGHYRIDEDDARKSKFYN